jgi:hypothetical protein
MKKIFMASLALTCLSVSMLVFQMASCKKAVADPTVCPPCPDPKYPVTGLWEGTYQTDQVNHSPTYVGFTVFPDGTFIRRGKIVGKDEYLLSKGRWQITGNVFQYRDTTILYSGGLVVNIGTMTYDSTGVMSNAIFEDIYGQSYTGTFQNLKRNN